MYTTVLAVSSGVLAAGGRAGRGLRLVPAGWSAGAAPGRGVVGGAHISAVLVRAQTGWRKVVRDRSGVGWVLWPKLPPLVSFG